MGLEHGDLAAQDVRGLAALPLLLALADAGDHVEPGGESRLGAPSHGLVGLAEVLSPLRVPDDRAVDSRVQEHGR